MRPFISHCYKDGTEHAGSLPNQDRNHRTRSARDADEGRGRAGAHFGVGDVVQWDICVQRTRLRCAMETMGFKKVKEHATWYIADGTAASL